MSKMLKMISNVTFSPCLYIVSLSDRTKEEKHFTISPPPLLPRVMMIAANKCVMLSSRRERAHSLGKGGSVDELLGLHRRVFLGAGREDGWAQRARAFRLPVSFLNISQRL